jgi:hypothetical protein
MSKTECIACVVKTVGFIALAANDLASAVIALFIFWAYVNLPKIIREIRESRQSLPDPADRD